MLVKTLLIALVSFIGFLECGVGNSMIQRPFVMGPLVGLVLGDVNAGLAVGATLELAFMGNVTIGAALPPEITAGGILGTALGTLEASVGRLVEGGVGDVCIVDPAAAWTVQPQALHSQGKHTPFSGYELPACVRATLVGGQLAFER